MSIFNSALRFLRKEARILTSPIIWLPNSKWGLRATMFGLMVRQSMLFIIPACFSFDISNQHLAMIANGLMLGAIFLPLVIMNSLLIASAFRKKISNNPTFGGLFGICGDSVIMSAVVLLVSSLALALDFTNFAFEAMAKIWIGIWSISTAFALKEGFDAALEQLYPSQKISKKGARQRASLLGKSHPSYRIVSNKIRSGTRR